MTEQQWLEDEGRYGRLIRMLGPWSPAAEAAVQEAAELELNYARGWSCDDYAFLARLSHLQGLSITDWTTPAVRGLEHLASLRELKVFTYCDSPIPVDRMPLLERCTIEWRAGASSLLSHTGVREVFINRSPARSFTDFASMSSLTSLSLASPRLESWEGVGAPPLTFLGVYEGKRLATLDGVQAASRLVNLEIVGSRRIHDLGPLAALSELRTLRLCDDGGLDSLGPLASMARLERLMFLDSTDVLDGDLGVLARLPALRRVAFHERAHYSHTHEMIETAIRERV